MSALLSRRRAGRLAAVAGAQTAVQAIGFAAGIVLVRHMPQTEYGYYTMAVSLIGMANVLTDLGLGAAVMARGGRLLARHEALGGLLGDARALHRRVATVALALFVPCVVALLLRLHAPAPEVALLAVLIAATAVLNVRTAIALSVTRVLGHVAFQQRTDLAVGLAKLALLMAAAWLALDAVLACLVNLIAAAATLVMVQRHLDAHVPPAPGGGHAAALRDQLRQQAPNALYFVASSQIAVWLIGVFGGADRVAEVGALGRLAAVFAVIGAVSAALVQPYFARRDDRAELLAGFTWLNAFYAAVFVGLVLLATAFPAPLLWVLGKQYAALRAELVWMVASATLSAWGGALYSIACARGWVLPASIAVSTGLLATIASASAVDVSTVRGGFIINTATALVGTVVGFVFFLVSLRRQARLEAAPA